MRFSLAFGICLLFISLLSGPFAHAQSSSDTLPSTGQSIGKTRRAQYSVYPPNITLAPTVGLADMALRTDGASTSQDTGLSVGGLLDLGRDSFALETGLLFNQFGGTLNNTAYGSVQFNLNYLAIPVFGKINFSGNPKRSIFIKGGLMPSILLGNNARTSTGLSVNNALPINSFDLPGVLGLGGALPINDAYSLVLEADYVRSLLPIASPGGANLRNEGFLALASIQLGLN